MGEIKQPIRLTIKTLLIILTHLTLAPNRCESEIKTTRIRDDSRPMILFERFGFGHEGHVSVGVSGISWRSRRPNAKLDPSAMGFFLVREASFPRILNESEYASSGDGGGFCVLGSRFVKPVLRFGGYGGYNGSAVVDEPDEYSLAFGNCQAEFEVSMEVRTEVYNVRGDGGRDYLPAGETPLPTVYCWLFGVYGAFLGVWIWVCLRGKRRVDKIHVIMGALLIFKALKLLCAAEDKVYVRRTGTPHGWDVPFYIFSFFKGITLFTVIALIGTGWSFLKPYLQDRDKKLLIIIIPLQVLENLASIMIGENGPTGKYWLTWNQIFLLVDIICCAAVFFPIAWSIRALREASKSDGKAARNLRKLVLFKRFYGVVVGYLYSTRIVIPAVGGIVTYRYEWVITAAAEGASLSFYLFVFYNFQPAEKNPYLQVADDAEEEAAGLALQDEDDTFEL